MAKGTHRSKQDKISVSVNFDRDEFTKLNDEADDKFVSFSEIVRQRLSRYRILEEYGLHEISVAD